MLASVVFAFETTLQPLGLLPLLGGCTASFLVSCLLMRNTIMTEKIARRGVRAPTEYDADFLDQVLVRDVCIARRSRRCKRPTTVGKRREWIAIGMRKEHRTRDFPILDQNQTLVGVLTRRDLVGPGCGVGADARETYQTLAQVRVSRIAACAKPPITW